MLEQNLKLKRAQSIKTAAYGHMGRDYYVAE